MAVTGRNATQRARMVARMARRADVRAIDEDDDLEPSTLSGRVKGTDFDWQASLFLDDSTGELWDGGDREARDTRDALGADWKLRQLAEVLTSSIKGAGWKLVPGKGDTGEAEDTEDKLRRPANLGGLLTPMDLVIAQASSSIYYTKAYFAKNLKLDPVKRDGSVLYRELAFRPASTCRLVLDPKRNASFNGFAQDIVYMGENTNAGWDGKPIHFLPKESLVFVHGRDKDPVKGASDLEVAMWCWRTKRKVLLLWLSFLEAQALPRTLVGYRDGDDTKAKKAASMIAGLKSSGTGYYDKRMMDVDVLDLAGKGAQPFMDMAKYLDSCASGSVLAGFTDLTAAAASGKGSFALSSDSRDMFGQGRQQAAKFMEYTFRDYMVADLVRYNYGPTGVVPGFKFDELAGVDEAPLIQLLTALATAQSTVLPVEFVNELALHAARLLDLDVDKVKTALEAHAKEAAEQAKQQGANVVGQQAAAANGAIEGTRAVARKVAAGGGGGGSLATSRRAETHIHIGGRA